MVKSINSFYIGKCIALSNSSEPHPIHNCWQLLFGSVPHDTNTSCQLVTGMFGTGVKENLTVCSLLRGTASKTLFFQSHGGTFS